MGVALFLYRLFIGGALGVIAHKQGHQVIFFRFAHVTNTIQRSGVLGEFEQRSKEQPSPMFFRVLQNGQLFGFKHWESWSILAVAGADHAVLRTVLIRLSILSFVFPIVLWQIEDWDYSLKGTGSWDCP